MGSPVGDEERGGMERMETEVPFMLLCIYLFLYMSFMSYAGPLCLSCLYLVAFML